jgi:hypothetical protein
MWYTILDNPAFPLYFQLKWVCFKRTEHFLSGTLSTDLRSGLNGLEHATSGFIPFNLFRKSVDSALIGADSFAIPLPIR